MPYSVRQRQTIYKQIGIDPSLQYTEEELEEYIILKAVRDYNHSKFALEDHIIIEGIIKDVFQGAVPDLDAPIQDYSNLQECLHASFESQSYDFSKTMMVKALQFYEILRSKHGCIMIGDHQAGKTTLINLLMTALNKAALNEYMLAVQDHRKVKMLELVAEYERQQIQEITLFQAQARRSKASDMIGGANRRKNKKQEQELLMKKTLVTYQDIYRQTALTEAELQDIRDTLSVKGVIMKRINPKSMTMDEMFGTFDGLSNEFKEGIFTHEFRQFSLMQNDKKKWILFDGPVDYNWVENLNSILDDNKKMSLPSGEQIVMSEGMALLIETNNMRNITPATVSRCGLICLHRVENCDTKAIFNQWLRNLTPNLKEYSAEIEGIANFLMVEAIQVFEEEERALKLPLKAIDLHWLMQNFVRMLTAMVFEYFLDYERQNEVTIGLAAGSKNDLGKSLHNLNVNKVSWQESEVDPNVTAYASEQAESRPGSKESGQSRSQIRIETPDLMDIMQSHKRLPRCSFMNDDRRYENAIKYTPVWIEAFVIFSLVWTFNPVLSDAGKRQLDDRLRSKYELGRTDYQQYLRDKKKKEKDKKKQQKTVVKVKATSDQQKEIPRSADGLTLHWTDEADERPMLISNFPEQQSFFDYYFDLDYSQWAKFSLEKEMENCNHIFSTMIPSQKKVENIFVPNQANIRHSFVLECLVTKQISTLVIGPGCSGRSALLRNLLFDYVFEFSKQVMTEHITMSKYTDAHTFKSNVELLLEYREDKVTKERVYKPPMGNKIICYIQDLHLGSADKFGDQGAIEAIRDCLTTRSWLSTRKLKIRKIQDVSFFTDMANNQPQSESVSGRLLHNFNLIVQEGFSHEAFKLKMQTITDFIVQPWAPHLHIYSTRIVNALVDIGKRIFSHLRPTPLKAQYTFNWRSLSKIVFQMQMAETGTLKSQEDVMKLFYHECLRTIGDRILMQHDRQQFLRDLEDVCRKSFSVAEESEVSGLDDRASREYLRGQDKFLWRMKPADDILFSQFNAYLAGVYTEVQDVSKIQKVIEAELERFNDQHDKVKIDIYLYNQLNRHMVKMLRVLSVPNGHLLNVAMKGFGMSRVTELVCFAAGHRLFKFDTYQGYSTAEWQADLKTVLQTCATADKPVTLYLDEYRLAED